MTRSISSPLAVSITTRTPRVAASWRSVLHSSVPDPSGSIRSSRTRSGRRSRAWRRPSLAVAVITTSWPSRFKLYSRTSRISASSSTTRMRYASSLSLERYDSVTKRDRIGRASLPWSAGSAGSRRIGLRARGARLGHGRFARGAVRQKDGHGRAFASATLDPQVAAVRLDDPVDDRETEAGAARARREERIERPRSHLGVHALAGVDDVDREAVDPTVLRRADPDRER